MIDDSVIQPLAVALWREFNYALPTDPQALAVFVIKVINEQGTNENE